MSEDKRIKRFATMDEVLLHPGQVIEHIEQLRTQIYHMQKKLRKQNYKLKENAVVIKTNDDLLEFSLDRLSYKERSAFMLLMEDSTTKHGKRMGLIEE